MQRSLDLDLNLPKNPYQKSVFRPEHDEELSEWFNGLREDLNKKIDLVLSDSMYHSLVLDIVNLDEHIRRTPLEIVQVAKLIAKTKKKEYETKRDIKKAEARAYFDCVSKGVVSESIKKKDGTIVTKNKKPTQAEIDNFIAMDTNVMDAHKTMAEVQESLIVLQAYAEALHSKQIMLAGMQGRYRDAAKIEMGG